MVAYQALVLTHDNETVTAQYATKLTPDLPKEGVLIKVAYSDINYKDRLTMNAKSGVLKNYPATPGVDFVGTVVTSDNPFLKQVNASYVQATVPALASTAVMHNTSKSLANGS